MYYPVHLIVELRVSNVQRALLIGVTTEQTKLQWMSLFNAIKYLTASKRKTGKQTNLHQSIACPTRVESWGWIRRRMGRPMLKAPRPKPNGVGGSASGENGWAGSMGGTKLGRIWAVDKPASRTTSEEMAIMFILVFVWLLCASSFYANERVCLVCVCVRNLI